MGSKETITDWDIQALLDKELSPQEESFVLQALQQNPDLQARYNALRNQKNLLQLWWKDN